MAKLADVKVGDVWTARVRGGESNKPVLDEVRVVGFVRRKRGWSTMTEVVLSLADGDEPMGSRSLQVLRQIVRRTRG